MAEISQSGMQRTGMLGSDKMEELLASVHVGIVSVDSSLHIRKIMPNTEEYTDLQPEDVGRSVLCVPFFENYPSLETDIRKVMETGNSMEREFDNAGCSLLLRIYPDSDETNHISGVMLVIMDITELKRTYHQMEQEKDMLNIIADMSGDLLFEYDIAHDRMHYTKQSESIINENEIVEHYTEVISQTGYMHPQDTSELKQFCEELRMGKEHIHAELRKKYRDNRYHWVALDGTTIYDFMGKPIKVIGHTMNIDERKKNEEKVKRSLEIDSMTGLYNRQTIVDKVRYRLSKKVLEQSDWLLVIDVDNFKMINDSHGHLVGDAVLCLVADELKNSLRKGLIGRIGGDEFVAYLENVSREKLEETLRTLNERVQDAYKDTETNLSVTCSIGVVWRSNIDDYETLFRWADYALYQVKLNNKRGYYIITPDCKDTIPENGYLEQPGNAYIREEKVIHDDDDMVVFALELLSNVAELESGLKIVADRICSFYDIDDIAYIVVNNDIKLKKYHWNRRCRRQSTESILTDSYKEWEYIFEKFDERGIATLHEQEINKMQGLQVGAILFVKVEREDTTGYLAFIDRTEDRNWEKEKDGLQKLAGVFVNHIHQLEEIEKERSEIEYKINYDGITGLPKYQRFIDLAEQRMAAKPNEQYYFVYSDFANFQYVNERYGYTEGDKILTEFAEHISQMPEGIWFTRVTSDHFTGMLKGESEEAVQETYLALTTAFCRKMNQRYNQCNLIVVSGLSSSLAGEAASYAVDRANVARKYGKDTAHTVVNVYNQQIKEKNEIEKAIYANMAQALENKEFKAWLQPKVSLKTGKVVGAEALVRWQRPDGSMIYPDKFIPIFEKNGFISNIDFAVLEQVLCYLRVAMNEGEEVVPVSVNFSRRHNEETDFVSRVVERLKTYGIPPHYLEAELTESIFMLDFATLTENIHKLKENGISISIDDFGSGYSSLNVLANVEADIIKLDRFFLNYADEDDKALTFIKYLVKMMKHMGYKVLAEGVETEEQIQLLNNVECDMVQGFYYARPMPIENFRDFLKEFNK